MARGFTVQYDQDYFRILGPGGEEGELADMGSCATLEIGNQTYGCVLDIDVDEGETPAAQSDDSNRPDPQVFLVGSYQRTEYQVVEFDLPPEEGEPDEPGGDGVAAVVVDGDEDADADEEDEPDEGDETK